MTEVCITGIGVLCPLGRNTREFAANLFSNQSGITDLRGDFLPSYYEHGCGGVVKEHEITASLARNWQAYNERITACELNLAQQAISELPAGHTIDALTYGTHTVMSLENIAGILEKETSFKSPASWQEILPDFGMAAVADFLHACGHGEVLEINRISTQLCCSTGLQNIGIAFENIRNGIWKRCLVITSDWRPLDSRIARLERMGALSDFGGPPAEHCRPFDSNRSGTVISQGGAAILLEAEDIAIRRSAKILGKISGYGVTCDAFRIAEGRGDAAALQRAMGMAMKSAGINPQEIDYISAHGTGTIKNDRLETMAIKEVFGADAYRIPVSSLKSQIGHTLGACGTVELVGCVLMLNRQMISPTLNYSEGDPECDLDYVAAKAREGKLNYILKNALGMGGHNACLVIKRPELLKPEAS